MFKSTSQRKGFISTLEENDNFTIYRGKVLQGKETGTAAEI